MSITQGNKRADREELGGVRHMVNQNDELRQIANRRPNPINREQASNI